MLSLSSFFIQSDGSSPNWTDCTKAGSPPASSRSPSRTQQRHATAPCSKTHANFAFLLSGCRCQNLSNIYLAGHQLGLREFSEVFNTKKLGWWSCEVSSYLQYLPPTYYDLIFSHRMVHFQFKISLPFGVLIDWCLHAFNVSNLPGWQLTSSFTIPDFIHGPKRALLKAFLPNIIVGPKSGELTPLERFAESALAKDILKIAKTIADDTIELTMHRSPHLEFYDERWLGMRHAAYPNFFRGAWSVRVLICRIFADLLVLSALARNPNIPNGLAMTWISEGSAGPRSLQDVCSQDISELTPEQCDMCIFDYIWIYIYI